MGTQTKQHIINRGMYSSMKESSVVLFASDWEYRKAQQEQRKQERLKRDQRRGHKHRFDPLHQEQEAA